MGELGRCGDRHLGLRRDAAVQLGDAELGRLSRRGALAELGELLPDRHDLALQRADAGAGDLRLLACLREVGVDGCRRRGALLELRLRRLDLLVGERELGRDGRSRLGVLGQSHLELGDTRLGRIRRSRARARIRQLPLQLLDARTRLGELRLGSLEPDRGRGQRLGLLGVLGELPLELRDARLGRIRRGRTHACIRQLLLQLLGTRTHLGELRLRRRQLGGDCFGGRSLLLLRGKPALERGHALLGRVRRRRAGARGRQLALQLLEQLASLVALPFDRLELGRHAGAGGCLLAEPSKFGACARELVGDGASRGLPALRLRLELREARHSLGGGGDLRLCLLQARALALELRPQLRTRRAHDLELPRELLGAVGRLVQRGDLLAQHHGVVGLLRELGDLLAGSLELLAQLPLARVALVVAGCLARGQLGLERCDAFGELTRTTRRLRPLGPRSLELRAQRHEQLVGIRAALRHGQLRTEPVDLGLHLALAELGELAVDHVLEPGPHLQQLDLVDGDLALQLAQPRGIDGARLGLALRTLGDLLELALAVGERRAQPLDLDVELVQELRILEHALGDLAPVALALDAALELLDALFLALDGLAQLHGRRRLLGQPSRPSLSSSSATMRSRSSSTFSRSSNCSWSSCRMRWRSAWTRCSMASSCARPSAPRRLRPDPAPVAWSSRSWRVRSRLSSGMVRPSLGASSDRHVRRSRDG